MKKEFSNFIFLFIFLFIFPVWSTQVFEMDTLSTSKGDLIIHFIGHGTLMFEFQEKTIHVDPFSRVADYTQLPKADIILITHHHGDHLDLEAINLILKKSTSIVLTEICAEKLGKGIVMKNNNSKSISDIKIKAVPAYNIQHMRKNGHPYHPKGEGNGYIVSFGDKNIYIAGDTENIPEMKKLKDIDVAFLPMNLPYTMSPEMVADAIKLINPKITYPYHFGQTNTNELIKLFEKEEDIEIRIRNMQ